MTTENEQVTMKQIAYWPDGYFIAEDDAAQQGEILDSVNAFGGKHTLLDVPASADREAIQELVNTEFGKVPHEAI